MGATIRPGVDAKSRACFWVYDESGRCTGKYAYSEQKANEIAGKTGKKTPVPGTAAAFTVSAGPKAAPKAAREIRKGRVPESAASRSRKPCPICGLEMVAGTTMKVENGRWVHVGCRQQEETRVAREVETAHEAALKGAWWLTDKLKPEHLGSPWPAGPIAPVPGSSYTERDVARLLGRSDREAYPVVLRLLNRMWERQTEDEQASGDAHHKNYQGFSKPDASRAQTLLGQAALGYTPELHYRISQLLSRYAGTQLLQIMNEGAARTGKILKTNPWAVKKGSFGYSKRDLQDGYGRQRRMARTWRSVKYTEESTGIPAIEGAPMVHTYTFGPKVTEEQIRSVIPYFDGARCQHSYDCCGNWYPSKAEIRRRPDAVVVTQEWYQNT